MWSPFSVQAKFRMVVHHSNASCRYYCSINTFMSPCLANCMFGRAHEICLIGVVRSPLSNTWNVSDVTPHSTMCRKCSSSKTCHVLLPTDCLLCHNGLSLHNGPCVRRVCAFNRGHALQLCLTHARVPAASSFGRNVNNVYPPGSPANTKWFAPLPPCGF